MILYFAMWLYTAYHWTQPTAKLAHVTVYMPELEAWDCSLRSFRRRITCNTSSDSLGSHRTQNGHSSTALCHVDAHLRPQNKLSLNVHVQHKPAAEKAIYKPEKIAQASCEYLYQISDRALLENRKLGLAVIHALVTQLPQGVLQLIAAQQQLAAGFRAAAQVNIHSIESLLEVS